MNDYALKYYRSAFEDPVGVPCQKTLGAPGIRGAEWNFDLTQDTFHIRIARPVFRGPGINSTTQVFASSHGHGVICLAP